MKTYLDHEFWKRIGVVMQSNDNDLEQEAWLNFKRFLKNETDLFLNINLNAEKDIEYQIYNTLTSGRGQFAKIEVTPERFTKLMDGPLLFQNLFDNPDNLFLLEPREGERLKKWKEKNGFLICDHQCLFSAWLIYRQLDTTKYPRSFSVRANTRFRFNLQSFADLSIYKHPVTDFIIADRFLFNDKGLLESNLPNLLESVIELRPNINCSLFGASNETFEKSPERLKNICLKILSKFKDIKIEIILDDGNLYKEHDRHLITNYFYFKPGDSFSLFKSNNQLKTKGTSIDIKSLFDYSEIEAAKSTIQNLLRIRQSSFVKSQPLKNNRLFNLI